MCARFSWCSSTPNSFLLCRLHGKRDRGREASALHCVPVFQLSGGSAARRRVYTVYRVPLDLVFELRRVADCDTLHPRRTPIARDEKTRSGPQKIHSPNHRASQAQTLISNLVHVWETHTHTYGAHGNMSVSPGQSYAMMRITSSSEPRRSSGRPRHQGCGHSPVRIAPRRQRESLQ